MIDIDLVLLNPCEFIKVSLLYGLYHTSKFCFPVVILNQALRTETQQFFHVMYFAINLPISPFAPYTIDYSQQRCSAICSVAEHLTLSTL